MTKLDRILLESDTPEPSATFVASVMREVRTSGSAPAPLAFPWLPIVAGVGLTAALVPYLIGRATELGGADALGAGDTRLLIGLGVLLASAVVAVLPLELFER